MNFAEAGVLGQAATCATVLGRALLLVTCNETLCTALAWLWFLSSCWS